MKRALNPCSVIVRTYNEEKHIGRLLTGILQQSIEDTEIILVDSGSTDNTLAIAARYPLKIIRISPRDFSFGYSLNVGCRAASGDILIFASAHVYPVYRDWLEKMAEPFRDPDVALVYGKQRGNEDTRFSEKQVFAKFFPDQSNFVQRHPFCNNANAAVRRDLWATHPYDTTLTGLEDIDWANHVLKMGYRLVYQADAEIVHIHNETPLQIYHRYRREAMALKRIFPEAGFSLIDFFRLYAANLMSDFRQAFGQRSASPVYMDIPRFRLMQFWGTYRGFTQSGPLSNRLKRKFYFPNGSTSRSKKRRYDEERHPIEYPASPSRESAK